MIPVEQWVNRATATVKVPVNWTHADVADEAAGLWDAGWEPSCQGGTMLLLSPLDEVVSLSELFDLEGEDSSWPIYAEAVWLRLVEVCEAMLLGNRHRRRKAEKVMR